MKGCSDLCASCEHLYVKDGILSCNKGYEIMKYSERKVVRYGVIECFHYKWNLKEA